MNRRSLEDAYGPQFFADKQDGSARSAARVLPLVFDLVRPSSVIDVGCGTGAWLAAARQLGATDILGIDGDWVPREALLIPSERFVEQDLGRGLRAPHRFDLAICMEVAEHLDATRAESLVNDLCGVADTVLFSAAVPGQTGADHRNEQWPPYWRSRFRGCGYELVDCLRARLWSDDGVEPWYAQNAYLYINRDRLESDERLQAAATENGRFPLCVVHPGLFRVHSQPFAPPDPEPREHHPAPSHFEASDRC